MRIACLGWGSLVWSPGVLRCRGKWRSDGPSLPVEFARTSRDGRLTLVLLRGASPVPVLWTELDYWTPEEAQAALAGREACGQLDIGLWPGRAPRCDVSSGTIAAWAKDSGCDAVVWAALGPKFAGEDGRAPPSAMDAVAYLRGLDEAARTRAEAYVVNAPTQIRTPFRAAFEEERGRRQPG